MDALRAEFDTLLAIRPKTATPFHMEPFGLAPPPSVKLPPIAPYLEHQRVLVVIPPEDAAGFVATAATVCPHVELTCMPPPSNGLFKQNIKLIAAIQAADCVVWSAHGCAGDGCIVLLPVQHKQFKFAALPVHELVHQLVEISGPGSLKCLFLDVCYGLLNIAAAPIPACPALAVSVMQSVPVYGYASAPLQSQSPLGLSPALAHRDCAQMVSGWKLVRWGGAAFV